MITPIHDFLTQYTKRDTVRCHMPGAKGQTYPFDITEIDGADSLFESSGIIKQSEDNAARLFGAKKTLFSCGGSTLAIQTMLALVKAHGNGRNRIVAGRFSHKSLICACALLDMEIDWIYPEEYLSSKIQPHDVLAAITPNTAAVFAQSIDYYGGESDIKAISDVCKKCGVPLIVDNAHGAYKVFTGNHPLIQGADMTADSAHKTLPCITGGAYLHIGNEKYIGRSKEMMSVFGSSSPSYLILDSLDLCNRHIETEIETAQCAFSAVANLKKRLSEAGYSLFESDLLRITINAVKRGYTGFSLASEMRGKNVECEYADNEKTVLLFSTITSASECKRVFDALIGIEKRPEIASVKMHFNRAQSVMSIRSALFSEHELVPVENALNNVCGGIAAPCPPCVPLVMPGEKITESAISLLKYYGTDYISIVKL